MYVKIAQMTLQNILKYLKRQSLCVTLGFVHGQYSNLINIS